MKEAENSAHGGGIFWRILAWSLPVLLLLLPAVAMRFDDEVNWTGSDFVFAGLLFASVGLAFEMVVRKSRSLAYRLGAALAVITAFLTIWVNGAVGMIGSEGNPFNLLFGVVLLVALLGSAVARFAAAGMARAMAAAAIAQVAIATAGLSMDLRGALLSIAFAAPWLLAAASFRKAAREQGASRAAL